MACGKTRGFRISFPDTGREVTVTGKADLLSELGLSTARGTVVSGCRGGGCGICRVRIVSGDYSCRRMSQAEVPEKDRRKGYALACQLFPLSDLVVETVGKKFRHLVHPAREIQNSEVRHYG